jgi:hypothetical protein
MILTPLQKQQIYAAFRLPVQPTNLNPVARGALDATLDAERTADEIAQIQWLLDAIQECDTALRHMALSSNVVATDSVKFDHAQGTRVLTHQRQGFVLQLSHIIGYPLENQNHAYYISY